MVKNNELHGLIEKNIDKLIKKGIDGNETAVIALCALASTGNKKALNATIAFAYYGNEIANEHIKKLSETIPNVKATLEAMNIGVQKEFDASVKR